jgi:hypothetical protein
MKLAEALALRADTIRRITQLRNRIAGNARYQEGETPAEDAADLLRQAESACAELETLIGRINATNAATALDPGPANGSGPSTVTEAMARRDALRIRHAVLTSAADAAAGSGGNRHLRSELTQVSALPVAEIRTRADRVAGELRRLDLRIQQCNWETELLS